MYWEEKNQYIEKKVSCWNKYSVFKSDIETVLCMFHETHFHCPMNLFAPFDLHIIIRWPENVRRVNKICLHCGHFIHCYILLNFVYFFSSPWQCVTISVMSLQNMKIVIFCFGLSNWLAYNAQFRWSTSYWWIVLYIYK
jgi:hypothetical protein